MLSTFLMEDTIIFKELQINEQIRDSQVRLLDENGDMIGIVSSREAKQIADEKNLDLVKISPNAQPPVCKIMNYGKYRFEQIKRDKEARKNQTTIELKQISLSMTIDVGDLNTKAKQCNKFLSDGARVKVNIRMRGRQQAYSQMGIDVMNRFAELCSENGIVEKKPLTEDRNIFMILGPKKK